MHLNSNDSTTERLWENSSEEGAAMMMKNIQHGMQGPLSGFIKQLISGTYSKNTTDILCKKANFFFWMSPSHSTIRLLRPQSMTKTLQPYIWWPETNFQSFRYLSWYLNKNLKIQVNQLLNNLKILFHYPTTFQGTCKPYTLVWPIVFETCMCIQCVNIMGASLHQKSVSLFWWRHY